MANIVVYSTNRIGWGGSEILWKKICIELSRSGHRVMASAFNHEEKNTAFNSLKEHGIILQKRLPFSFGRAISLVDIFRNYIQYLKNKMPNKYWRQIYSFKPDLVLFNLGEAFEADLIDSYKHIKKLESKDINYSLMVHFINHYAIELQDFQFQIFQDVYQNAQNIFFMSHANKKALSRQLFLKLNQSVIVSGQVEKRITDVDKNESPTLHLAIVSRLEHQVKGQDILIEYISQIDTKNLEFHFFGSGKSEEHLFKLAAHYGVSNSIHFHGHIEDVEEIWRLCDVLLLCSEDEGLPLSALEAMSYGKPFISTRSGGMSDLPEDLGFFFNIYDVQDFSDKIEYAKNNRKILAKFGKNCRSWIQSHSNSMVSSLEI